MLPNPGANPDLYGRPKAKNVISTSISSASAAIALSSELAKLASAGPTNRTKKRTSNSSKSDDLFKRPNKGVAERAARDEYYSSKARKTTSNDIGHIDDADLKRARKKMEEKTRLYNAMKRGDYVPPTKKARTSGWQDDDRPGGLIDFDKKWAEHERNKDDNNEDDNDNHASSDDDDGSEHSDDNEVVDHIDEFGRARKITKKDLRKERRHEEYHQPPIQNYDDDDQAIPLQPRHLIVGDTIQTSAFDVDDLSRRHDDLLAQKEVEELHYDATAEVRTKGVGFYQFSKDGETRRKEMEALNAEREKTTRERLEREARKDARRQEVEERRQELKKRRQGKEAEKWLEGFMEESGAAAVTAAETNAS